MSAEKMSLQAVVRRRPNLSVQDLDGDLVMADIQSGQFYGLGTTAKTIWNLLESPNTPTEICGSLTELYEVEQDVCEQEVLEFLGELKRSGLVTIDP